MSLWSSFLFIMVGRIFLASINYSTEVLFMVLVMDLLILLWNWAVVFLPRCSLFFSCLEVSSPSQCVFSPLHDLVISITHNNICIFVVQYLKIFNNVLNFSYLFDDYNEFLVRERNVYESSRGQWILKRNKATKQRN